MIGYVTLGSNDRKKAGAFYDELLGLLGAKRVMEDGDRLILWSNGQGPMLGVIKPFDGNPATVGNGDMVALAVGSRENVDKIHAKALAARTRARLVFAAAISMLVISVISTATSSSPSIWADRRSVIETEKAAPATGRPLSFALRG